MPCKQLKFYDLKARKSFITDDYGTVKKNNRIFAVTTAPSGISSYRILKKR